MSKEVQFIIFIAVGTGVVVGLVFWFFTRTQPSYVLTPQETVTKIKECEDLGLRAEVLRNGLNQKVRDIVCLPR